MTPTTVLSYIHGTKPNGAVTTWWRKISQGRALGEVKVPCNGCTACCREPGLHVPLLPEGFASHPEAVPWQNGLMRLPKKADGSCMHLVDDKCSIYQRRPYGCRSYDCRWRIFTGIMNPELTTLNTAIAAWEPFKLITNADKALLLAAHRVGRETTAADGDFKAVIVAVHQKLQEYYPQAMAMVREFNALPAAERQRRSQQVAEQVKILSASATPLKLDKGD